MYVVQKQNSIYHYQGGGGGGGIRERVPNKFLPFYTEIAVFIHPSSVYFTGISLINHTSRVHHARKILPLNLKGVGRKKMDLIKSKCQSI